MSPVRLLSLAVAVLACGSVLAQSMNRTPPRVVSPDKLERYWLRAAATVEAQVPYGGRNIDKPGCATVAFIIEPDGSTSDAQIRKVVPDGDLGQVALSIARGMRFDPTPVNPERQRVFSWLIFPFNLPADEAGREAAMEPCQLEGLRPLGAGDSPEHGSGL